MKKSEFLSAIEKGIYKLSDDECARSLDYFSEMLEERIEDGMDEEEAVASLGSVDEIIKNILAEVPATSEKSGNNAVKRKVITEYFDSVAVNDICRDVNFFVTQDDNCYVEYKEIPGIGTVIKVEDRCLRINAEDNRRWFDKLRINLAGKGKLDVYVPAGKYTELKAHTVSGDLAFGAVRAVVLRGSTVNGDVVFSNIECNEIHISTTNGDVTIEGDPKDIHITTVNGDVKGTLGSSKDFHVTTVVGDVRLPAGDKTCGSAHITTVSGDVEITIKD